jgi:hypothetical protein
VWPLTHKFFTDSAMHLVTSVTQDEMTPND